MSENEIVWQTRGMKAASEWQPWTQCSETQAKRWLRDVSYRIGRREVRYLIPAAALAAALTR